MDCNCEEGREDTDPGVDELHKCPNWSELPDDILCLIMDRLSPRSLFCSAAFRSVCRSWRLFFQRRYSSILPPQPPWLMIPNLPADPSKTIYRFMGLNDYGRYFHNYEIPKDWVYVGSSGAWVIFTYIHPINQKEILLVNPLARLSRISGLPSKVIKKHHVEEVEETPERYNKVVVSCSDPLITANNLEDVVLAAIYDSTKLGFLRVGNKAWMPIEIDEACSTFHDITLYQQKLYAVNQFGVVFVCDLAHHPPKAIKLMDPLYNRKEVPKPISPPLPDFCYGYNFDRYYLVEVSGNLILVCTFYLAERGKIIKPIHFNAFKLDFTSRKWRLVKDLGDNSLVLGTHNASMSFSTTLSYSKNSMFFIEVEEDEHDETLKHYAVSTVTKTNYLDLCEKRVIYRGKYHHLNHPPIWIMPRYHLNHSPIWIIPRYRELLGIFFPGYVLYSCGIL